MSIQTDLQRHQGDTRPPRTVNVAARLLRLAPQHPPLPPLLCRPASGGAAETAEPPTPLSHSSQPQPELTKCLCYSEQYITSYRCCKCCRLGNSAPRLEHVQVGAQRLHRRRHIATHQQPMHLQPQRLPGSRQALQDVIGGRRDLAVGDHQDVGLPGGAACTAGGSGQIKRGRTVVLRGRHRQRRAERAGRQRSVQGGRGGPGEAGRLQAAGGAREGGLAY